VEYATRAFKSCPALQRSSKGKGVVLPAWSTTWCHLSLSLCRGTQLLGPHHKIQLLAAGLRGMKITLQLLHTRQGTLQALLSLALLIKSLVIALLLDSLAQSFTLTTQFFTFLLHLLQLSMGLENDGCKHRDPNVGALAKSELL